MKSRLRLYTVESEESLLGMSLIDSVSNSWFAIDESSTTSNTYGPIKEIEGGIKSFFKLQIILDR